MKKSKRGFNIVSLLIIILAVILIAVGISYYNKLQTPPPFPAPIALPSSTPAPAAPPNATATEPAPEPTSPAPAPEITAPATTPAPAPAPEAVQTPESTPPAAPQTPAIASEPTGNSLDSIIFGSDSSEQEHNLKAVGSETIHGGLSQAARRLMPGGNIPWEGGTLEWDMKVDPAKQNYVTVKLWGSDHGSASGRLLLFAKGLQVGYRHEGDYDVLNQCDDDPLATGRFVYVTLPLPPSLTKGETNLRLKIHSLGTMWPYGQTFEQYQKDLTQPTRGIYCAYSHTDPRFVPDSSEAQGSIPSARTRSTPGDEVIKQSRENVIGRLSGLLAQARSNDQKSHGSHLALLAESYNTRWTPAYKNHLALEEILRGGDSMVQDFTLNDGAIGKNWSGAGELGVAVMRTWPDIEKEMDAGITIGKKETSRREAWSKTLRQSVDYWRTHRRAYTNQSMIVDFNIYYANRALELIDPQHALPEEQALRYAYEAVGIEPWLGSDLPTGGSEKPYGANYRLITRKGLSRELGYVGTYGETILSITADFALLTGDKKILEQLQKMQAARMFFRYPGIDGDGFQCMKLLSEVDNRTAHYPVNGSAYNSANVREAWWMETAALLPDDPISVGGAQQSVEEGQYFAYIEKRLKDPQTREMMLNVDNWEKVHRLPKSPWRIPTTAGQPDFVFADEEDAMLAIKHGDTLLYVNLYYRAERGVNRVARILEITPSVVRLVTARTDVEVIGSGETYERPDWIDWTRGQGHTPPGQDIHQAWAGEKMPISKRPDDASTPKYQDNGPFVGKAAFYSLHYGDYLIGVNTTENHSYNLPCPEGFTQATDLVSGQNMYAATGVKVGPLSTVVLYLGKSPGSGR